MLKNCFYHILLNYFDYMFLMVIHMARLYCLPSFYRSFLWFCILVFFGQSYRAIYCHLQMVIFDHVVHFLIFRLQRLEIVWKFILFETLFIPKNKFSVYPNHVLAFIYDFISDSRRVFVHFRVFSVFWAGCICCCGSFPTYIRCL